MHGDSDGPERYVRTMQKEAGMMTIIVDNSRKIDVRHVYNRTLVEITLVKTRTSPGEHSLWIEKVEALTKQHSEQHTALGKAD